MALGKRRFALGALVVAGLAGCRPSGQGTPCHAVAARLLALGQAEARAKTVDDALRQRVLIQLPALRDSIEQSCSAGRWADSARSCMVAARDGAAFAACQEALTDEQRARLRQASGLAATP